MVVSLVHPQVQRQQAVAFHRSLQGVGVQLPLKEIILQRSSGCGWSYLQWLAPAMNYALRQLCQRALGLAKATVNVGQDKHAHIRRHFLAQSTNQLIKKRLGG